MSSSARHPRPSNPPWFASCATPSPQGERARPQRPRSPHRSSPVRPSLPRRPPRPRQHPQHRRRLPRRLRRASRPWLPPPPLRRPRHPRHPHLRHRLRPRRPSRSTRRSPPVQVTPRPRVRALQRARRAAPVARAAVRDVPALRVRATTPSRPARACPAPAVHRVRATTPSPRARACPVRDPGPSVPTPRGATHPPASVRAAPVRVVPVPRPVPVAAPVPTPA